MSRQCVFKTFGWQSGEILDWSGVHLLSSAPLLCCLSGDEMRRAATPRWWSQTTADLLRSDCSEGLTLWRAVVSPSLSRCCCCLCFCVKGLLHLWRHRLPLHREDPPTPPPRASCHLELGDSRALLACCLSSLSAPAALWVFSRFHRADTLEETSALNPLVWPLSFHSWVFESQLSGRCLVKVFMPLEPLPRINTIQIRCNKYKVGKENDLFFVIPVYKYIYKHILVTKGNSKRSGEKEHQPKIAKSV